MGRLKLALPKGRFLVLIALTIIILSIGGIINEGYNVNPKVKIIAPILIALIWLVTIIELDEITLIGWVFFILTPIRFFSKANIKPINVHYTTLNGQEVNLVKTANSVYTYLSLYPTEDLITIQDKVVYAEKILTSNLRDIAMLWGISDLDIILTRESWPAGTKAQSIMPDNTFILDPLMKIYIRCRIKHIDNVLQALDKNNGIADVAATATLRFARDLTEKSGIRIKVLNRAPELPEYDGKRKRSVIISEKSFTAFYWIKPQEVTPEIFLNFPGKKVTTYIRLDKNNKLNYCFAVTTNTRIKGKPINEAHRIKGVASLLADQLTLNSSRIFRFNKKEKFVEIPVLGDLIPIATPRIQTDQYLSLSGIKKQYQITGDGSDTIIIFIMLRTAWSGIPITVIGDEIPEWAKELEGNQTAKIGFLFGSTKENHDLEVIVSKSNVINGYEGVQIVCQPPDKILFPLSKKEFPVQMSKEEIDSLEMILK